MTQKKKHFSPEDKIAFIGSGKMAEAIIFGLLKSKLFSAKQIVVFDVNSDRIAYMSENYGVSPVYSVQKAVAESNIVVLAFKPQNFPQAVEGVSFPEDSLVISIAAGITLSSLNDKIKCGTLVRVMPNNPALIQKGISAVSFFDDAKSEDVKKAVKIFESVGEVIEVKEDLMDAVTALSGSGPGFVYLIIEAMIEAGEALGLTKSNAEKLALHTIIGSAEAVIKTKKAPRELREMVTSPGGTTKAGLNVLEAKGFNQILIEAIKTAEKRAKELSKIG